MVPLLVFLMTPGLSELVDDALHLVRTGHTEHAAGHHDGEDAEHGCTGTFHTCSCHQSATFLPGPGAPELAESSAVDRGSPSHEGGAADGVRRGLLRPPQA